MNNENHYLANKYRYEYKGITNKDVLYITNTLDKLNNTYNKEYIISHIKAYFIETERKYLKKLNKYSNNFYTFNQIENILNILNNIFNLSNIIYLGDKLVPHILKNTNAFTYKNLNIFIEEKNIPILKNIIKENNYVIFDSYDFINYEHGFIFCINNIPIKVNILTFVNNNTIIKSYNKNNFNNPLKETIINNVNKTKFLIRNKDFNYINLSYCSKLYLNDFETNLINELLDDKVDLDTIEITTNLYSYYKYNYKLLKKDLLDKLEIEKKSKVIDNKYDFNMGYLFVHYIIFIFCMSISTITIIDILRR